MKTLFKTLAISAVLAASASAQVISDFDTLSGGNYSTEWSVSFASGVMTVGSPSTGDQGANFADVFGAPIVLTDTTTLDYRARVDAGNQSLAITLRFADDQGTYAYSAQILTDGWVAGEWETGTVSLVRDGESGNGSAVSFFTISGDSTSNPIRISLDKLEITSAIPEPSSFAAIAGLGILGFAASRRRRVA